MKIIITESQLKSIILNENDLTFYHGGLDPNATISDIDVFKLSNRQQKKGREYAGFYMSPDMDENSFAMKYYNSKPNSGLHKITLPEDSKVYEYPGLIERITKTKLEDLYKDGYDYIAGNNLFGGPEFVLLNKDKATIELVSINDSNEESEMDFKNLNIVETYNNAKNFLKDNFGIDFSGRIQQITSTYDVPMSFDDGISPEMIRPFLNYWGPMYLFELDGVKYLYQDRGDYEWFIDEEGYDYVDNEIPEQLGIAEMGFSFSDIVNMYFQED